MVLEAGASGLKILGPALAMPSAIAVDDFASVFAGAVVRFSRTSGATDSPAERREETQPKFGFSWFVPELLRHRSIWRDVLLASLAVQIMGLAVPLFTQVVIDKVVVHQTSSTLAVVAVALLLFMLFTALMNWIRQYLVLHTGNRVDAVLGSRVFAHLLALPARYFDQRPTGTVVARLQGVETIREFVSGAAVTLLLDLPFMLVFAAVMFWYSWMLSLIVVVAMAAVVAISLAVVPSIREKLNRQFLAGARNQAFVTEHISAIETVKSLQMEPRLKSRYDDFLADYLEASFRTRRLSNTYGVCASLIEQLQTLAVLVAGAWLVMQNEGFTIGMLVAFQMFSSRVCQPILRLTGLWQEFQQAVVAVRRLGDLMNAPAEPDSLVPTRPAVATTSIEFAEVSFRHAENLPYLYRGFNFQLGSGECVALMGPSGSGKSTLAKLLLGTCMPTDGQIRVNGRDTRTMPVSELRAHFGVVLQDSRVFSGSLYENLVNANPRAGMEDIARACRLAEIHDFIVQLPDGYQTRIGEQGIGLSGGQKQRLAIARALLRHPRVLIFDEAGSNLDAETAEQIGHTVSRLKGGMSILFIAHQLPASLQVDRVCTLGFAGAQA
jgi:subfamily B ATP-binding cassette protein HlyB/CyaB